MSNKYRQIVILAGLISLIGLSANAEFLDRPSGFKIGERLTLRPSVSMSLTYDANLDPNYSRANGSKDDFLWTVSPTLGLTYNAEKWSVLLSGYYNWRQYFQSKQQQNNQHTFGEDLRINWASGDPGESGWSFVLGESYHQISAADDMLLDNGQNYSNDSKQFQISAAIQRQFNQNWHGDVNGSYSWLKYDNDEKSGCAFYGWDRALIGAEMGFAPSPWTDFLLSGSWQHYNQDNMGDTRYDGSSQGLSLQGGIGSYMTERISYRVLAGWSQFEYAGGESKANGFVYTISGNWKIGETWNTMLMATSYYQPSEREQASKSRVDAVSWGIAKSLVSGKLRATFDIRYSHQTQESLTDGASDYNLDIWTGRFGLDYTVCRYLAVFGNVEYQNSANDAGNDRNSSYDYDRWRATVGFRLQY